MDVIIVGIIAILAVVASAVFIECRVRKLLAAQSNDAGLVMLNQNVQGMHERIDETTKALNSRLDRAAEVIVGVSRELGHMQEIGRSMKDLQDFLKSPKLRGNVGEQVLKDLLEQYFPRTNFDTQHQFNSGERVDAILKTDKGLIPIDAKFPMENFQKLQRAETDDARNAAVKDFVRDVKKHVTDIAKKYILPGEGTVDFAVMYIPSESVYYEVIQQDEDLNEFAREKHVLFVSPNSFYYFLKVLLIGLEGKKIEEGSRKILEALKAIQQDAGRFSDQLGVLTTHLTNAKNTLDRVNSEYAKLSGRIEDVRLLK
jgi:DNA recombination protein RmuC